MLWLCVTMSPCACVYIQCSTYAQRMSATIYMYASGVQRFGMCRACGCRWRGFPKGGRAERFGVRWLCKGGVYEHIGLKGQSGCRWRLDPEYLLPVASAVGRAEEEGSRRGLGAQRSRHEIVGAQLRRAGLDVAGGLLHLPRGLARRGPRPGAPLRARLTATLG